MLAIKVKSAEAKTVKKTSLPTKEINLDFVRNLLDHIPKIAIPSFFLESLLIDKTVEAEYDIEILFGNKDNPNSLEFKGKSAFLIEAEKGG